MDEALWEELLRSPYEEDRSRRRGSGGGGGGPLLFGAVALAVVAGGTLGWYLAPEGDVTADPSSTTTTSSSLPDVDRTEPGFLPDYVVLGDTAMREVTRFDSLGTTYVVFSEIVRSDLNRSEVAPMTIASYATVTAGGTTESDFNSIAALAPGLRLVGFGGTADRDVVVGEGVSTRTLEVPVDIGLQIVGGEEAPAFAGFPIEFVGHRIPLDATRAIVVDRLVATEEWGTVAWHMEGPDAVAKVEFFVTYVNDEVSPDEQPGLLIPRYQIGPRFGQSQPPSPPGLMQSGVQELVHIGNHVTDSNLPSSVIVSWRIEWSEPTGDVFTIPVTAAAE